VKREEFARKIGSLQAWTVRMTAFEKKSEKLWA
jgi:hypothetical protein